MTDAGVRVVASADGPPGSSGDGIRRETAFDADQVLLSRTVLDPGFSSGWHHHGNRGTYALVDEGRLALDFGSDGTDYVEVAEGGIAITPPGVVHRDRNPTDERTSIVAAFVGPGDAVVEADGPAQTNVWPSAFSPGELADAPPVGGVDRATPDPGGPVSQVQEYVRPKRTTDWRHHGESDAYGYVRRGSGRIEWARTGDRRATLVAGDFFRVSPGFTHRFHADADALEIALWIVGPGPDTYPLSKPIDE